MKRILIVVDMQTDFVDGALGTPEAVAILENVTAKINTYAADPDGAIFVTYDTHAEDYMTTSEGKHLPVPPLHQRHGGLGDPPHCGRCPGGGDLHPRGEAHLWLGGSARSGQGGRRRGGLCGGADRPLHRYLRGV